MRWIGWITSSMVGIGCAGEQGSPIRLTLDDGQVIVGDVQTDVLALDGALGTLKVPLEDVGEVVPVEGHDLKAANGQVVVWLRNGTELRGKWADPELRLGLQLGGEQVDVDLPMSQMVRFQTPGAEAWPSDSVFRVKTTHGDDLLVDPETTRITVENALGRFSPFLSECRSLAPVGAPEGDWRVELVSGTVLVGPLAHDALTFAMPLGPAHVEVPLANVVSMSWQNWGAADDYLHQRRAPEAAPVTVGEGRAAVWFDNSGLGSAKSSH
jgi:hypothetical protein